MADRVRRWKAVVADIDRLGDAWWIRYSEQEHIAALTAMVRDAERSE